MPVTLANWKPRRNPIWPTPDVFYNDLAIFALGCTGAYSFNVVGSLPGCEILVLVMAPFLLVRHGERAFRREYLLFYLLLFGWFLGTVMSDVYMDSPLPSRLKGIARVIFWALDFIVLAILINRKTRAMIVFALGFILLQIASARGTGGDSTVRWKFGLGYATAIVLLLISSYFYSQRKYWICFFISLFLAALDLIFAARSALLAILVSAVFALPILAGSRNNRNQGSGRPRHSVYGRDLARIIVLLALAGAGGYLANEVIKYGTEHDFFSEGIEQKFQQQANGKLGMLVGGRPETLVAIQAIRDSPILGHGSFALDVRYLEMMQDIQYEYGYTETDEPEETDTPGIPTHSHLTNAWVDSGILGGIFWIYIIVLTIRSVFTLATLRPKLAPLNCFFLVLFVWDILYSPMGNTDRIAGDYFILIAYQILADRTAAEQASSRTQGLPLMPGKKQVKFVGRRAAVLPAVSLRSLPNAPSRSARARD